MRVVINQPNYIPWRGYFDLIDDSDLFLFYDDVQYTPRDWRNRNRIKTRQGTVWLTVPVVKTSRDTLIKDVLISYNESWVRRELWPATHRRLIAEAYGHAPYFSAYAEEFFGILEKRHKRLADLDMATTQFIMRALGIQTPTRPVSELNLMGSKTEKLTNILQAVSADEYLSGPAAKNYIDVDMFVKAGIVLQWKSYDYEPYPQLWGAFEPQVSALDLLFNCGPDARRFLKSLTGPP